MKNIYQCLVVLDPYKEIFISKVCLEVTDPIKMYVIIKAVSIHLNINIIMKSKNVWQKLLVGNKGLYYTVFTVYTVLLILILSVVVNTSKFELSHSTASSFPLELQQNFANVFAIMRVRETDIKA